jgi:prephenate dehydrogenase
MEAACAVNSALEHSGMDLLNRLRERRSSRRDVTRLAASSPEVWAAIAADNRDEIGAALRALAACLAELTAGVETGDRDRIHELLAAAAAHVRLG